ncbi:MAG: O-antigen ligase family protein [Burkholderiaceae bacterium]|nr:O-antigen ligase family protein [Burkholderiaceae bacterium]
MNAYLVPLTLATSLVHPKLFGIAWHLLVLICLVLTIQAWLNRAKTSLAFKENALTQQRDQSALKIWLIAFGPLTAVSALSLIVWNLPIGRAEIFAPFIGGLALILGLTLSKLNRSTLLVGASLASWAGFAITIYEYGVANISRTGDEFVSINFGIVCGSMALLLMFLKNADGNPAQTTGSDNKAINFLKNPWMINASLLAAAIGLLGSGSRGPIISFMLCAVVAAVFRRRFFPLRSANTKTAAWVCAAGFFFVIGAGWILYTRFIGDIAAGKDSSAGIRWQLIQIALEEIAKSPWIGIGADQAGKLLKSFPMPIAEFNHIHMTLLNLGLELGVVGALCWLWAFGVLAWVFSPWRTVTTAAVSAAGFFVCAHLLASSMTQDILSHSYSRNFLALIIALLLLLRQTSTEKQPK